MTRSNPVAVPFASVPGGPTVAVPVRTGLPFGLTRAAVRHTELMRRYQSDPSIRALFEGILDVVEDYTRGRPDPAVLEFVVNVGTASTHPTFMVHLIFPLSGLVRLVERRPGVWSYEIVAPLRQPDPSQRGRAEELLPDPPLTPTVSPAPVPPPGPGVRFIDI